MRRAPSRAKKVIAISLQDPGIVAMWMPQPGTLVAHAAIPVFSNILVRHSASWSRMLRCSCIVAPQP